MGVETMGNVNGNFRFEKTSIDGLQVIYPFIAYDERGFFMKTYEQRIFKEHGIEFDNAEDMVSYSHKGVLRGMHFQTEHSQDKLIRVLHGEIWDVAVDLRKDSKTFGKWEGFYLSEENKAALYIPSGFAHGFLALTDDVLFTYRCGELYYPNVDSGIIWNDSTLQVDWPLDRVEKVILSEKDKKLQTFEQFLKNSGGF
jgi:dTDP-4-dehydrorhamnose 3,5-epimerase